VVTGWVSCCWEDSGGFTLDDSFAK
jgi:hypothetical protein